MGLMRVLRSGLLAIALLMPVTACAHEETESVPSKGAVNYPGSAIKFTYFFEGPLYERMTKELKEDFKTLAEIPELYNEGDNVVLGFYQSDLNGDGIPELFINLSDQFLYCNEDGACHNFVFSEVDGKLVRLGHFPFSQIAIASTTTDGVKDLQIYTNPLNPHEFDLAKWNPATQTYELKAKQK